MSEAWREGGWDARRGHAPRFVADPFRAGAAIRSSKRLSGHCPRSCRLPRLAAPSIFP
jgi:hypothetical protein